MECIVLFKGGVETQEYFSIQLSYAFEKMGYEILWYDLLTPDYSYAELLQAVKRYGNKNIAAFTFNHNGIAGEEPLYRRNAINFWDEHEVAVYNMVVDHPLYYHKYLGMIPRRYCHISIDRNHEMYMKRFFPYIILGGFIPLGGTELNEGRIVYDRGDYLPLEERKIDVIFTGNYTPKENFEKYLANIGSEYIDFYHSLVEEAIDRPDTIIEQMVEKRLNEEIGAVSDDDLRSCMTNMMFVDLSVRFHYRAQAVKQLVDNGIKVYTYGEGWYALDCKHHENLIEAGGVSSQKCLDMISQSKISLNVMPWFKDGAHDRIFNTMLNGALSLTDDSRYLKEEFTDEIDIKFFSLSQMNKLPEMTEELLKHPVKMQEIIKSGYDKARDRHKWEDRAHDIIKVMNIHKVP